MFDLFIFEGDELLLLLIKLGIVMLLSGMIGLEREMKNRPAGLRTHMIVALTSMLIMHIGSFLAKDFAGGTDPARMAAQVVSGIGFLGAGTILRGRAKDEVHGLTTAATLWAVSAVGISIGAGYIWEGLLSTIAIMAVLSLVSRWDRYYSKKRGHELILWIRSPFENISMLQEILETNDYILEDYAIQGYKEDEEDWLKLYIRIEPEIKSRTSVPRVSEIELLESFSFIRDIQRID